MFVSIADFNGFRHAPKYKKRPPNCLKIVNIWIENLRLTAFYKLDHNDQPYSTSSSIFYFIEYKLKKGAGTNERRSLRIDFRIFIDGLRRQQSIFAPRQRYFLYGIIFVKKEFFFTEKELLDQGKKLFIKGKEFFL